MTEILKAVRHFDPALKQTPETLAYAETLDFAQVASLTLPGKKPAVFYVQRATRDQWRAIRKHGDVYKPTFDALETAFAACVTKVEAYPNLGAEWRPATPSQMTFSELDAFDVATIEEIGRIAIQEALLPKGSARRFQRSLTSLRVADLMARARRSVVKTQADASAPSSDEP